MNEQITQENDFLVAGAPLKEFKIVYDERCVLSRRAAILLMAHIRERFGISLEVTDDSAPDAEHEILIGNTVRTKIKVLRGEFLTYASTKHLKITFGSSFAYEALRVYLTEDLFSQPRQIKRGWLYSENVEPALCDGREYAWNRQGSLRILTANIFGAGKSCEERMRYLRSAFTEYSPDIILLQEVSVKETAIENNISHMLLEDGYREIFAECENNNEPVVIRAERFDVLESGHHIFSMANNGNSKQISWAVLRDKKEGRVLATFSTHFYYDDDEYGLLTKLQNVKELYEICEYIKNKYDCPIIGGGDLNGTKYEDHIQKLFGLGFESTLYSAEYSNKWGTCSARCVPDEELGILTGLRDIVNRTSDYERYVIDHIVTYGKHMKANTNIVIADEAVLLGTDHAILYVDADYPQEG